jgi:hypothetical protein
LLTLWSYNKFNTIYLVLLCLVVLHPIPFEILLGSEVPKLFVLQINFHWILFLWYFLFQLIWFVEDMLNYYTDQHLIDILKVVYQFNLLLNFIIDFFFVIIIILLVIIVFGDQELLILVCKDFNFFNMFIWYDHFILYYYYYFWCWRWEGGYCIYLILRILDHRGSKLVGRYIVLGVDV